MTYTRMDGTAVTELNPGVAYQLTLDASGGDDCSADAVLVDDGEANLYLHVANGGSTFETFNVDDDSAGAIVV
jgi:hypothetical protein